MSPTDPPTNGYTRLAHRLLRIVYPGRVSPRSAAASPKLDQVRTRTPYCEGVSRGNRLQSKRGGGG